MVMKNYPPEFKADAVALVLSRPDRTITSIARDLGVSRETLRVWVRAAQALGEGGQQAAGGAGTGKDTPAGPVPSDDVLEEENKQLKARIRELEQERDILRKAAKPFRERDKLVNRSQFVEDHKLYGVKRLCRVLQVSRSGFYRWLKGAAARLARRQADEQLAERVRRIHSEHDGTYGSPRMPAELRAAGIVNHKRVERVMREHGIAGLHLRKKVRTTIPEPDAVPVPDLIQRDFTVEQPGTRYVGDITYLPVGGGRFLYLATVVDLWSRRLVGWSIADHMRTELVVDALQAAAHTRGGRLDGAVFHSDNGAQYCSREFARACRRLGVTRSRGAVGTSADNAAAESFNASLKRETLQGTQHWPDARTARLAVFRWITRYNTVRRHSRLGRLSPIDYEKTTDSLKSAA
ncbi:IS3 family transposase [Nonomuraea wenchangensis]|uniref:IS3 family transposase n=1 Tax=Nonomuraea wenchangensis TaxID=568860 RepID=UPI00341B2382